MLIRYKLGILEWEFFIFQSFECSVFMEDISIVRQTMEKGRKIETHNVHRFNISIGNVVRRKIGRTMNYKEYKQCSFQSSRTCTNNLFCLKHIIEKN